ncbi:single-stranded DNA-binding protein [Anaerosalibacter bizertensis]|uniref:Single-stranded DNA-binding protein n=1 Tax=Anaerosalibacter bizertensis TaxID=932217 RepID=A0A844FHJ8_9FIRM|nr:single-stranded DNA-binding protein [Anaerosalibacter bizertensis]MBV1817923.1 single-stranded DNA-binding protein [Bacteroidales bacterium MSK.15.36]HHV27656.1 single-stranded DNA-binding protein [Tissierellia bacterium]MBU5294328.1 single-stranded DNA-binding protein [Anaerosalibacter bizertensis]MCB5559894.1 single-stranded DNA-binding protein [Anaerosalibacter bizertensis]MCG4564999.1 single-stranded DNA-binding protein [Anaerosalibacter bizertensis]
MNNVVLIGRLTRDPELRFLPVNGTPVSNFSLAVDKQISKEKKQEMESKGQPTADFINIVVWGKQAENCANYLAKGRLTAVQGRLQSRSYEAKDGTRRYITEVVAERVQFLEWGDNNRSSDFSQSTSDYPDIEGFHPVDDDDIPF